MSIIHCGACGQTTTLNHDCPGRSKRKLTTITSVEPYFWSASVELAEGSHDAYEEILSLRRKARDVLDVRDTLVLKLLSDAATKLAGKRVRLTIQIEEDKEEV